MEEKKLKILNLYAGIGGNRKKWFGNINVTAIELDPEIAKVYKELYPDDVVIVADAHQFLLDHGHEYDFIFGSPPCQSHSKMMKATRHKKNKYTDMTLYQEILFLTHFYKGKWCIENVAPYYEPLITPTAKIGRHLLWSNFKISSDFKEPKFKNFITSGTVKESEELKKWLGLNYEGNLYYKDNHCPGQILRNCVHPDLGEHILNCLLEIKTIQNKNQLSMF